MNHSMKNIAIAATLLSGVVVAGCGEGSSSAGTGSSSGFNSAESSSIVLNMSSGIAMRRDVHMQPNGATMIAALLSDLLVRQAQAQESIVYVDGAPVGTTMDGTLSVAVKPGMHWICVNVTTLPPDPEAVENCVSVDVGPNEVWVVSIEALTEPTCTGELEPSCTNVAVNDIQMESAFDYLELFESDKAHKVYVCHKGKTINVAESSVGRSASVKGHQAHGDDMGPCDVAVGQPEGSDGDSGNNGNRGNNGNSNRCNKGKPDKKNCESSEQA